MSETNLDLLQFADIVHDGLLLSLSAIIFAVTLSKPNRYIALLDNSNAYLLESLWMAALPWLWYAALPKEIIMLFIEAVVNTFETSWLKWVVLPYLTFGLALGLYLLFKALLYIPEGLARVLIMESETLHNYKPPLLTYADKG